MSTQRTLTILLVLTAGALVLSLVLGCSSTDRQWRESQTVLENLPQ